MIERHWIQRAWHRLSAASARGTVLAYLLSGALAVGAYVALAPTAGVVAAAAFLPWYLVAGWYFGFVGAVLTWTVSAILSTALAGPGGYPTPRIEHYIDGIAFAAIVGGILQLYRKARRSTHALAESEERFRRLAEASFEGIVIAKEGRVVQANRAFLRLVRASRDEIVGTELGTFVGSLPAPPDPRTGASADDASNAPIDVLVRRKDGSTFEAEILVRAMTSKGELLEALGVRDVTARKQAEETLRRNERLSSLGTLVAGVAHEINNPLAYIRGNVELIDLEAREIMETSPEHAPTVEMILDQASTALEGLDRIANITRSLKQLARAPTGVREREDLARLTAGVAEIARPRVPDHVRLELGLQATPPVLANGSDLARILLNLIFNAADATKTKGSWIRVRTFEEAGFVVVEIEDDGIGIPRAMQEKLFTPFFTTKDEGTGLGLSLSRTIANEHGGDLTFRSKEGEGAVFRLSIPAIPPPEEEHA